MQSIRPIRSPADHRAALEAIVQLWGSAPGSAESDQLEVLVDLVEHYELRAKPPTVGDPIETLRRHMVETDRTQADLALALGSRSRASEILNRRRPLSIAMIRKLNAAWGLPVACLIGPSDVHDAA